MDESWSPGALRETLAQELEHRHTPPR
jgi:hypothetical protein